MLCYFYTRAALPAIQTPGATAFQLLSAENHIEGTIPFSHIYATSDTYLKLIKSSLGEDQSNIVRVSDKQSEIIRTHRNHPINVSSFETQSIKDLHEIYGESPIINLGVINGIGLNFNDNFIGLGIIQRLAKLLKPKKITISLMQTLNTRFGQIYSEQLNRDNIEIRVYNNCTSVNNFFKLDAYVDLSSIARYKEYNNTSLANFYATAFSIENLIPQNSIQPRIETDNEQTLYFSKLFNKHLKRSRPKVLFSTLSSLQLCNLKGATELVSSLIDENYNVISDIPDLVDSDHYTDCIIQISGFRNLIHMILACEFVVTLSSITYNLAATLGRPTILLPTYKFDIISASTLPEVLAWLPKESSELYLESKSEKPNKEIVDELWENINYEKLAKSIKPYRKRFSKDSERYVNSQSNKRIGVILLLNDKETDISKSLEHLALFDEFDPLWFYTVVGHKKTHEINDIIKLALADGCEYIWLLDNQVKPDIDFISQAMTTFSKNKNTGIVSGGILKSQSSHKVDRAAGGSFFPTKTHKSALTVDSSSSKSSLELWVDFDSTIIQAKMIRSIGMFDKQFYTEYKGVDLCLRAHLKGWKVYYNPNCKSIRTSEFNDNKYLTFNSDLQVFYEKWSNEINNSDINDLELNIRKYIKQTLLEKSA